MSLTVTWDVFEYQPTGMGRHGIHGLTVTWDVFEYFYSVDCADAVPFNRNMGCI